MLQSMPRPSVCDFTQLQVCVHVGTRPQANCTLLYFNDMLAEKQNWIWIWIRFISFCYYRAKLTSARKREIYFDKCSKFCTLLWVNSVRYRDLKHSWNRRTKKGFWWGLWMLVVQWHVAGDRQTHNVGSLLLCVCERVHALLFWHAVLPSDKFSLL